MIFTKPTFHRMISKLKQMRSRATACLLAIAACWLAGCAVGPNYKPPQTHVDEQFANSAQTNITSSQTVAKWWREFKDAELDSLVTRAVASNMDLRIATANLRQSRALRFGAKSDFFPVIDGKASYANTFYSRASLFNFPTKRQLEFYDAEFDATWELDIFGRVRRSVESAYDQVESAEASRRDVLVTLISEVARNYFELRGAQNELAVVRDNADNESQTLKLTEARLEAGSGTQLDAARAKAEYNNTLADIPPLEASVARAIHRISVLTGLQPTALTSELEKSAPIPELPAVSIGNPRGLLRRRPDIRVAERNLASATARIGVAVADLFPRVTFNGNIGLQSLTLANWGGPGSDTHSFGPTISWAALDLGHVRSRIKAAGAQADAQMAQYEKTVLTSLEETENALVDFGRNQARRDYLRESVKASQDAARLARERYDSGAADFLTVLDAERVLLQSRDQLAQTETQTATSLVALYKSLGGGWEE
jgi:multidrug efflux system outer membrane protein